MTSTLYDPAVFFNKSGIQRKISRDTSCWYPISSWKTLSVYLGPVYIKWLGPTFIPLPLQDWTIFDLCNLLPIITAYRFMIICMFLVEMGSDARLIAVKLVKFASQKYAKKKINSGILKLCKSLVDIISICYSNCSQRTQKKFCAFTIRASCSAFSAKPLLKIPRRWQLENFMDVTSTAW